MRIYFWQKKNTIESLTQRKDCSDSSIDNAKKKYFKFKWMIMTSAFTHSTKRDFLYFQPFGLCKISTISPFFFCISAAVFTWIIQKTV